MVCAPMASVTHITRRTEPAVFAFRAASYPEQPGCYLMRDASGALLYVGKAVNLRRRLSSYFRDSERPHRKAEMIRRIRGIDVFLVRNEREALVLESNLIRHHRPPYNSRFTRAGDSYYYIALTDERFPRFVPYRKERVNFALHATDGRYAELFGPYVGWRLRNRILEAVRELFPIRTCHALPADGTACVRAEAGTCRAPCASAIDENGYRLLIRQAGRFPARPPAARLKAWRREMDELSARQSYDEAGQLRDRIRALEHARLPQAVEIDRPWDLDVLWLEDDHLATIHVRDGDAIGLCIEEVPSGIALAERLRQAETSCVVCNPVARNLLTGAPDRGRRVIVPRSPGSRHGQLLEICRMNHRHGVDAQRGGAER